MRQWVLWGTLLFHHDFLVIDSPWCSRHNMNIHSSALRYAKYIAKIGSAENKMNVTVKLQKTGCYM